MNKENTKTKKNGKKIHVKDNGDVVLVNRNNKHSSASRFGKNKNEARKINKKLKRKYKK